jgi:putative transposase
MSPFFDREAEYQVHRRNLPHRTQPAVTYFVTFHLADSLPAKKLAEFKAERKRWLEVNPPPHSENQIEEYRRNFSQRIQKWLDAGYGSCILARPAIFRVVEDALKFFNGQRYLLGEYYRYAQSCPRVGDAPWKSSTRPNSSFMEIIFGETDQQDG